ncbi:MAG TPA: hypothetical protein PLZ00_10215 [Mangrovimonas sp.]|nr:hypothetical protein [Mangrovimonas sp.]
MKKMAPFLANINNTRVKNNMHNIKKSFCARFVDWAKTWTERQMEMQIYNEAYKGCKEYLPNVEFSLSVKCSKIVLFKKPLENVKTKTPK